MTNLRFLDIDPASADGAALIEHVSRRHGESLARVVQLTTRLFLLRSGWAPGLRFVGAQAMSQVASDSAKPAEVFSLGGCGVTLEDALASCLGETAERLSQVERSGDIAMVAPLPTAEPLAAATVSLSLRTLDHGGHGRGEQAEWLTAHSIDGERALLPADWCLRRSTPGPLRIPGAALSTGCAAGRTFATATAHALLELIERDATSLWWIGNRSPRPLPFEQASMRDAADLLRVLRGDREDRTTRLLDITSDLEIPAVAATSTDGDGKLFAAGFAARPSVGEAACAAILELTQMEVGLQLALLKQRDLGDARLSDDDRRHLVRATGIESAIDPRLQHRGTPIEHPAPPAGDDHVAYLHQAFERAGIDAALVDLTRADIGIPVVKAVAPELQLMPGDIMTARLQAAIAGSGKDLGKSAAISLV